MSTVQTDNARVDGHRPPSPPSAPAAWALTLAAAAFWMFLIWIIHRTNPRTLISFHGLLHAAIVEAILRPGGMTALPPDNPFFAGQPLAYYWFFHYLAAQLVRLLGMNVFHAMDALVIGSAGFLTLLAVALARGLYRSTLAGILIGYLVLAGTNPLGIVYGSIKVLRDGLGVLRDDPNHLWGVTHPLYSLIRFNDIGGLNGPLLNFFLNITSRPLALTALLLSAFFLHRALRDRRPWSWLGLGIAVALTTAFSPIIGILSGGALGFGLLAAWVGGRWLSDPSGRPITSGTVVAASVSIVGGILLAAPTYYHLLMGPSANQLSFYLLTREGIKHVLSIGLSISPLLALAVFGTVRAPREARQYLTALVLAGLACLALNLAFSLPYRNMSNMFHAAVLLLAVPAGGAILRRPRTGEPTTANPRRAGLIAAVFLPTLLALIVSYLFRPSVPASFQGRHVERTPIDSDLAQLYRWARGTTPPDAVFIIDPRQAVQMSGNVAEFPAMTGRSIFTEQPNHYLVSPYPAADLRHDLAVRLESGEALSNGDREYLAGLGRPVYLLHDAPDEAAVGALLTGQFGPPVFRQGPVSAYRLPL